MTTGTTTETHTPTYNWAIGTGATSSIIGLVLLAVCIYASAADRTTQGFAPVPGGLTALACVMVLGGLVLCLFWILHGGRSDLIGRLEKVDKKLDNVWGIAATTSIEAQPAHVKRSVQEHKRQRAPRRHRGQQSGDDSDPEGSRVADVSRLPSADVLRQARSLARRVIRSEELRSEDNSEDTGHL